MIKFELPKPLPGDQDNNRPWWANRVLFLALGIAVLVVSTGAVILAPSVALPVIGLLCGGIFFLYGLKYYSSIALILLASSVNGSNGNGNGNGHSHRLQSLFKRGNGNGNGNGNGHGGLTNGALQKLKPEQQPFISIQLPMFNEARVVDRLLKACTNLDYQNYEILVADDSSDMTLEHLERWARHPRVRVSHRINRSGFKGAALKHATEVMHPDSQFVAVFDADFIPPPDILHQFIAYFYGLNQNGNGNGVENGESNGNGQNGNGLALVDDKLAVVQGYQWHVLNASENWITRGIRTEFAGSYVVERSSQELTGAMKMISGSVFMIRADVLRAHQWGTSITEDWELTLRLYLNGFKVLYSPFIQAPAEIVSDFKQLARQRMRWAEGHTYNVKKHFFDVFQSPHLSRREKLEFLYYAPYYLTSALFIVGTAAWLISDIFLEVSLPFWSATLGWALVFTNAMALILMNLVGLFQERSVQKNWQGLLSFVFLTFLLVPYQAYAAMKGLLQPKEGGWHRTRKSGVITETVDRMQLKKRMQILLPKKKGKKKQPKAHRAAHAIVSRLPAPIRQIAGGRTQRLGIWVAVVLGIFALLVRGAEVTEAPSAALFGLAAVISIPIAVTLLTERRRRVALRVGGVLLSLMAVLGVLANQVIPVSAAPDVFYLHDATAGPTVNFEEAKTGTSAASATVATSSMLTAVTNDLYLASIVTKPDRTVSSVSGLGLTWNLVLSQCGARGQTRTSVFYAIGTPTASEIVTATLLSAPSTAVIAVTRYSGVNIVSPIGNTASGNTLGPGSACTGGTDNANPSVNLTTANSDSVVVGAMGWKGTDTWVSSGAGYTLRAQDGTALGGGSDAKVAIQDKPVAAPSTVAVDGTLSGTADWSVVAVEIKAASVSPAGKTMNTTAGSVAATLAFDTAGQDGYWYTDLAYPTGADDASIAAGTYTLNMYFNTLPSFSSYVSDTFTELSNTAITAHTPGTGTGWTEVYDSSTATTDATIDAVQDIVQGGSDENTVGQAYTAQPAPISANQALRFTLKDIDTTSGTKPVGLFGRRTDNLNFYHLQILPNANTNPSVKLFKYVAGVATELGSFDATLAAGDTFVLELTDRIKRVYHNGTEVISSTDNALTSIGTWGLYFGNFNGAGDGGHLRSTWDVDDFRADTVATVDITVTASHTDSDGSAPVTIVSNSTTITANTPYPLAFGLGSGAAQTFTAADPQLLRAQVHVDAVAQSGSFTMAYDSSIDPSNLETPALTVPDPTLLLLAAAILIPPLTSLIIKRRRLATRLISVAISVVIVLGVLSQDVVTTSAAPDTFYLHDSTIAVAFEEAETGSVASSTTVTTSAVMTAADNHLYLAAIDTYNNVSVSSVSGLGLSWTLVKAQCGGRGVSRTEVWKALGSPTADGTVTATLVSSAQKAVIAVTRYSGVNTASPIGDTASANTNGVNGVCTGGTDGTSYSVNITTTAANSYAYGAVGIDRRAHTPGTGYTERAEITIGGGGTDAGVAVEDKLVATASTVAVDGTIGAAVDWSVVGVEIKAGTPSPGGKIMNTAEGSLGSTLIFNTVGQDAYWYGEDTWPTGADDAGIAAGSYTANLYFNQLPTTSPPQVDAVNSGSTATSSMTISHTTSGVERLMLVGVSINNDSFETVISITYNGINLAFVGAVDHLGSGGDDSRVEIWQLVNPPTGTYDVVITFSADLQRYAVGGVITFTGVDQTTPLGTFASNYANGTSASVVVPSALNELALGVIACETCTSMSIDAPSTQQWSLGAGSGNMFGAGGTRAGASPNVTVSATLGSSDHWAAGGISVKPAAPTVGITASVHHTAVDGSGATLITSASSTITASTTDPVAINLGSAAAQTFTSADPRRLRLHVQVDSVTGGGDFILDYDGTCVSSKCSNLDTPVVTVPEWGAAFLLLVPLIPYLMSYLWKRRRTSMQVIGLLLAISLTIGVLARDVDTVSAAPDTFYFHPTLTTGITPAGEYMNNTQGSLGSTKLFSAAAQNEYWYADTAWPTGSDDASIAAGSYTANLYFAGLPAATTIQAGTPSSASFGAVSQVGFMHTTPAGDGGLLVVGVSLNNDNSETVSGIRYNGDPLTFLGAVNSVDDARVEIWYRKAPDVGTFNLLTRFSTYPGSILRGGVVGALSFTGVNQTSTFGTFVSDFAQGDPGPADVVASSAAGEVVFATAACESCGPLLPDASMAEQWNGNNTNRDYGAGATKPGAASTTMSWALTSSDHWAIGAVPIKPSGIPSVDITASVHHTAVDGTGATLITSATTTINSTTADPLALSLGSAALQTFTSVDPRVLRLQITVDTVNYSGSFVLDYDGTCVSNRCSNLDTPVVVVPEYALAFIPVVLLIPLIIPYARKRMMDSGRIDPTDEPHQPQSGMLARIKRSPYAPRLVKESDERRNKHGKPDVS